MQYPYGLPDAEALIYGGDKAPTIHGRVYFFKKKGSVLVIADIGGLPKTETGFFGFHIHEGTACTGTDFQDSKSHYDPQGTTHPSHAGDLPPLLFCKGVAHLEVLTDRFNVSEIIGKTVIIHNSPDDFTTQPSGNSGTKIACGVIHKTPTL